MGYGYDNCYCVVSLLQFEVACLYTQLFHLKLQWSIFMLRPFLSLSGTSIDWLEVNVSGVWGRGVWVCVCVCVYYRCVTSVWVSFKTELIYIFCTCESKIKSSPIQWTPTEGKLCLSVSWTKFGDCTLIHLACQTLDICGRGFVYYKHELLDHCKNSRTIHVRSDY